MSTARVHWLVSFVKSHGTASLSQALHIRITCYYMSLPLGAFQRETVPLCNESCAPRATLQNPEQRQWQREAMTDTVTESTKEGCDRVCKRDCDGGYDGDCDRSCDKGCDRDCDRG